MALFLYFILLEGTRPYQIFGTMVIILDNGQGLGTKLSLRLKGQAKFALVKVGYTIFLIRYATKVQI